MTDTFDLVVIGGGPGGYTAAEEAARLGKSVALVERGALGGTCLNRGCIPTKTILHTTELLRELRAHGEALGLADAPALDGAALSRRVAEVTTALANGVYLRLTKARVALFTGTARIEGPGAVRVAGADGETLLRAGAILAAAGAEPAKPPVPGMELAGVLTSDDFLADAGRRYESLVILGGGVIGMELASAALARGTRVTVLEALERPLFNFDRELAQNLRLILKKRGADIRTGARVTAVERTGEGLLCSFTEKDAPQAVTAEAVLVAAGRRACTEGLFAPGLSPALTRGCLDIDDRFETSIPGVYAIGDVTGGVQLAHRAEAQARNFAALLGGKTPPMRLDLIPACVYTDPEIACVGITEAEAKAAGRAVKTRKSLMSANGKSVLTLQERGFMKTVEDAETGAILGAQLMCARATDMISQFTLAAARALTARELGEIIRPHPTFEEAAAALFTD